MLLANNQNPYFAGCSISKPVSTIRPNSPILYRNKYGKQKLQIDTKTKSQSEINKFKTNQSQVDRQNPRTLIRVNSESGHKQTLSQNPLGKSVDKSFPTVTQTSKADELKQQISQIDDQITQLQEKKMNLERQLQQELELKTLNLNTCSSVQQFRRPSQPELKVEVNAFSPMMKENFVGTIFKSMKQGYGTQTNESGQIVFEGEWQDDKYHGRGRLYNHKTATCFTNEEFIDNLKLMKLCQSNLSSWKMYEGDFKNGLFDGLGILQIQEALKFHGNFKSGEAFGKGTLVNTANKRVFLVGDFEEGYLIQTTICRQ